MRLSKGVLLALIALSPSSCGRLLPSNGSGTQDITLVNSQTREGRILFRDGETVILRTCAEGASLNRACGNKGEKRMALTAYLTALPFSTGLYPRSEDGLSEAESDLKAAQAASERNNEEARTEARRLSPIVAGLRKVVGIKRALDSGKDLALRQFDPDYLVVLAPFEAQPNPNEAPGRPLWRALPNAQSQTEAAKSCSELTNPDVDGMIYLPASPSELSEFVTSEDFDRVMMRDGVRPILDASGYLFWSREMRGDFGKFSSSRSTDFMDEMPPRVAYPPYTSGQKQVYYWGAVLARLTEDSRFVARSTFGRLVAKSTSGTKARVFEKPSDFKANVLCRRMDFDMSIKNAYLWDLLHWVYESSYDRPALCEVQYSYVHVNQPRPEIPSNQGRYFWSSPSSWATVADEKNCREELSSLDAEQRWEHCFTFGCEEPMLDQLGLAIGFNPDDQASRYRSIFR